MTNHDTTPTQLEHHHPFELNARGRKIVGGAALLLVGAGITLGYAHNTTVHAIDKIHEAKATNIEQLIKDGPEGIVVIGTIDEGEATSKELERSTLELNELDKIGFVKDQQAAILESANILNNTVFNETKGSVQPETKTMTWRDKETNVIISTRYIPQDK
jgi:hypothetical protein